MHIRGNSFTNIQVSLYCTKIIILFNTIIYINNHNMYVNNVLFFTHKYNN
jgi:hypothetical protein